jgi:hypothetical protein
VAIWTLAPNQEILCLTTSRRQRFFQRENRKAFTRNAFLAVPAKVWTSWRFFVEVNRWKFEICA